MDGETKGTRHKICTDRHLGSYIRTHHPHNDDDGAAAWVECACGVSSLLVGWVGW